jgi:hypothetical protein
VGMDGTKGLVGGNARREATMGSRLKFGCFMMILMDVTSDVVGCELRCFGLFLSLSS